MRPLEEIIEEYDNLRASFKNFTNVSENNKDSLIEYQHRFVDLKADLRYWHTKMMHAATKRDEKACTGIKFRIAVAMVRDEYVWSEGEKPMYDKPPAIGNAEKFASASKQYKEFLEQRAFYKESLSNVNDLRDEISSYINLIKDRLK